MYSLIYRFGLGLTLSIDSEDEFVESQSFNPDDRRGIIDDDARILFYVSVVFRSHVLSSLPSHSFNCPLYSRVQYAREFRDVSIPSDFRDFILVRRSSHTPVLLWTSHPSHGIHRN